MLFTVISVFKASDAVSDERTAVASELNGLDAVNRLLAQRHASPTVYERHIIVDTGGNLAVVQGHDVGKHIRQGEVLHPAHREQFQEWRRAERLSMPRKAASIQVSEAIDTHPDDCEGCDLCGGHLPHQRR